MKATSNSYIGGMNKDNSPIKVDGMYPYHLENVRLFTDSGSTTLTIENILGNAQVNVTNISSFNYTNYSIVGHCNYRKDIILFYVGDYYKPSVARKAAISLLKYQTELHYHQIDLYNSDDIVDWRIIPNEPINCFANYETEYIQKVYWWTSQGYFHLNFAPNIGTDGTLDAHYSDCRATEYNKILAVPFIKFNTPTFDSYGPGQLVEGSVQYAYRLYNLNGNVSNISPSSKQIPISTDITKVSTRKLFGADYLNPDKVSNIGVRLNIDLTLGNTYVGYDSFDRVEVFRLHNNAKESVPTVTSIYKGPVQSQINIFDDGTTDYGTITYTEFVTWQNEYKFIAQAIKENRVFIGNIEEEYFDVDEEATWTGKQLGDIFDTRMYRFASSTSTYVGYAPINRYDTNGNVVTEQVDTNFQINSAEVNVEHDCINTFNDVSLDTTRTADEKFRYKSDGITLGGSGKYGSYNFEYYTYLIDEITNPRALNVAVDDTNKDYILGLKRGFQRDEIYRFGIVFFDKKGRRSFVKWIGDIRMPSIYDRNTVTQDANGVYATVVMPIFDFLVLPTINGELLDYQIVYVKRENNDKSVVAQGFATGVEDSYGGAGNYAAIALLRYFTTKNGTLGVLDDYDIVDFTSPDTIMDDNNHVPNCDRFDLVGYFKYADTTYTERPHPYDNFERQYVMKMYGMYNDIWNYQYVQDIKFPAFNEHLVINAKSYTHYGDDDGSFNVESNKTRSNIVGLTSTFNVGTLGAEYGLFNLRRYVTQYGGDRYVDRLQNTYIEASDLNSTLCNKGDIFIAYFDYLRAAWNITPYGGPDRSQEVIYFPVESSINLFLRSDISLSKGMSIDNPSPASQTAMDEALEGSYSYYSDDNYYYYDDVHSKPYDVNTFVPKPLDFRNNSQFKHQIRWTDKKLQGEETDSWIQFRANNYFNAESMYGPINRLVEFKNEIILFHDSALGVLQISPQVTQADNVGAAVVLGTGNTLQRVNYISNECGLQKTLYDVNKVVISPSFVYWIDNLRKKLYRYNLQSLQSLSDLKGFEGYFRRGIDEKSEILGTYDPKYSEVVITVRHPEVITNEFIEVIPPSTTISFNSITAGSYIDLALGTSRTRFTCTDNVQDNTHFEVGTTVEEAAANFVTSITAYLAAEGLSNRYTITRDGVKVTIVGSDTTPNFAPDIYLNTKILSSEDRTFSGGAANIFLSDPITITEENSVVLINPGEPGFPDKFEIWKKGINDADYVQVATSWSGNEEYTGGDATTSTNYGTTSLGSSTKEFYLNWLARQTGDVVNGVEITTDRSTISITDDERDRFVNDVPPSEIAATTPTLVSVFPTQNVTALYQDTKFQATMIECYVDSGENFFLGYENHTGRVAPMFPLRDEAFIKDTNIQDVTPFKVAKNYNDFGNCTVAPSGKMSGIGYGQLIWYKAQVGDLVKIRVTGSVTQNYVAGVAKGTGWSYKLWVLQQQSASIDSVEETKSSETTTYYRKSYDTIIDTQVIYGNRITVEDTAYFDMEEGGTYNIEGDDYTVLTKSAGSFLMDKVLPVTNPDLSRYALVNNNFTICFSEKLDAFTSFYSYLPERYIRLETGFITTDNNKTLWAHNYEDRCKFYGNLKEVRIEFMTNAEDNNMRKEWNNLSWYSEVYSNVRKLLPNVTLTSMRCRNAYQQTDEIVFVPYDEDTAYRQVLWLEGIPIPSTYGDGTYTLVNIRKTIDNWRCAFPRKDSTLGSTTGHVADYTPVDYNPVDYDATDVAPDDNVIVFRDRMRSPYTKLTFYFTSTSNRKLVLHDIVSYFENIIV